MTTPDNESAVAMANAASSQSSAAAVRLATALSSAAPRP